MNRQLTIAHLYPAKMNIYGDRGNILALMQRLRWRRIEARLIDVNTNTKFDFNQADIIFGGGGQDRGQQLVASDLQKRRSNLAMAIEAGIAGLVICGTYQLFGHQFVTKNKQAIPGIGIFDAETIASETRMIGNIVVKSRWGKLVGFENHSGQTQLGPNQPALGRVIKGFGNNESSKQEGAVYKNIFGSYMHGPLLPKNSKLADELISRALNRKYGSLRLRQLDDSLEHQAARQAAKRPR